MEELINKIGLDKIAHFGIGGVLFAAFNVMFLLANVSFPIMALTFGSVLAMPLAGYVIVAFAEFIKEVFIDAKIDWKDVLATFAGCFAIHLCAIIGYLFSLVPASGLINSTAGWIIFGVIMVALAAAWLYWVIKDKKKSK